MKKGITVNTDNSNFNRNLFKKNFFPKIMNCVFKANFNWGVRHRAGVQNDRR